MTSDPQRPMQTIATYDDYAAAQAAVDRLSDDGFAVENLRIVSSNLVLVEDVGGRKGYAQAAGASALSGAILGFLLGWILGIFSLFDPLTSAIALALWATLIGAAMGAIMGLIAHYMTGGERDFWSTRRVEASSYDLQATADHVSQARQALAPDATATEG